jgi:hypothetical protein
MLNAAAVNAAYFAGGVGVGWMIARFGAMAAMS